MVEGGQAIPEALDEQQSSLLTRLARLAILGPLSAGWRLFAGDEGADQEDGETTEVSASVGSVVLTALVDECAKMVLEEFSTNFGGPSAALMTAEAFKELVNRVRLSGGLAPLSDPVDLDLLIKHLKRSRALALTIIDDGQDERTLIKLRAPGALKVSAISPEECNVFRVRNAFGRLQSGLEQLSRTIQETRSAAAKALREKDRGMALFELRRCKALEENRKARMACVLSLQEVLLKIDAAQSDQELYRAYRSSEAALKAIVGATSVADVDAVIESLNELCQEQKILGSALSDTAAFAPSVQIDGGDDAELEAELDLLVEAAIDKELPAAPNDAIKVSNDAVPSAASPGDTAKVSNDAVPSAASLGEDGKQPTGRLLPEA